MVNSNFISSGAARMSCPVIRIPAVPINNGAVPIFIDNQPAMVPVTTPIGDLVKSVAARKASLCPPQFPVQAAAERPNACFKIYG